MSVVDLLGAKLRDVPDFPKPGVVFKDITPILQDPASFRMACDALVQPFSALGVDLVVGIESRGFIFGPPVALELGAGFQIARKTGKLPWETVAESYELEYGQAEVEMHRDAVKPGQRVLLVDDLIATGGTASATTRLVRKMGGEVVGASFLIELGFLAGRQTLEEVDVRSVLLL